MDKSSPEKPQFPYFLLMGTEQGRAKVLADYPELVDKSATEIMKFAADQWEKLSDKKKAQHFSRPDDLTNIESQIVSASSIEEHSTEEKQETVTNCEERLGHTDVLEDVFDALHGVTHTQTPGDVQLTHTNAPNDKLRPNMPKPTVIVSKGMKRPKSETSPEESGNRLSLNKEKTPTDPRHKRLKRSTEAEEKTGDVTMDITPQIPTHSDYQITNAEASPDLLSALRPLRDDLVKHMQLLQQEMLNTIINKIDCIAAENRKLREKLCNIESRLTPSRSATDQQTPTIPSTPPIQLPPFLDSNLTSTFPPTVRPRNKEHKCKGSNMNCDENELSSMPEAKDHEMHEKNKSRPKVVNVSNSSSPHLRSIENHRKLEANHLSWLKQRFTECFGLQTDMYKRRKIFSFDGVLLAKGFERVVATYQGLFFELRDEDINYEGLECGFNTARGKSTLSTKGVSLFKLSRADNRTTPRPHRFAVIPSGNPSTPCNPLKVGRWYVHVYQTRVEMNGNFTKALNSRSMAQELQKLWGIQYLPRSRDVENVLPQNYPGNDRLSHKISKFSNQQMNQPHDDTNIEPNYLQTYHSGGGQQQNHRHSSNRPYHQAALQQNVMDKGPQPSVALRSTHSTHRGPLSYSVPGHRANQYNYMLPQLWNPVNLNAAQLYQPLQPIHPYLPQPQTTLQTPQLQQLHLQPNSPPSGNPQQNLHYDQAQQRPGITAQTRNLADARANM